MHKKYPVKFTNGNKDFSKLKFFNDQKVLHEVSIIGSDVVLLLLRGDGINTLCFTYGTSRSSSNYRIHLGALRNMGFYAEGTGYKETGFELIFDDVRKTRGDIYLQRVWVLHKGEEVFSVFLEEHRLMFIDYQRRKISLMTTEINPFEVEHSFALTKKELENYFSKRIVTECEKYVKK